jgi:hypothetical protein
MKRILLGRTFLAVIVAAGAAPQVMAQSLSSSQSSLLLLTRSRRLK